MQILNPKPQILNKSEMPIPHHQNKRPFGFGFAFSIIGICFGFGRLGFGICVLALFLVVSPASAQVGFKLYKAKESDTAFISGGHKIPVWQFTPSEGEGPFPGIVLLYGLDGIDLVDNGVGQGGGIYNLGTLTLTGSAFSSNSACSGRWSSPSPSTAVSRGA